MKRFFTRFLCLFCCFQLFFPCMFVIAETVSVSQKTTEISELGSSYGYEEDIQRAKNYYKNFFEKDAGWDPATRVGTVEEIWKDMFSNYIKPNSQVLLKPKTDSFEAVFGSISNNQRQIINVPTTSPFYTISAGNIQGVYKDSATQEIVGTNLTGDVEVTLLLSEAGLSGYFQRTKTYDYQNPSSSIFQFSSVESYGYLSTYTYAQWMNTSGDRWDNVITSGHEPLSFVSTADVALDLSQFFTTMTQKPKITTNNVEIYQNESYTPKDSFAEGTDFFGERIFYEDLPYVSSGVNVTKPGIYRGFFDYYGYRVNFSVTVKEDQSTLNVKNTQIIAGSNWDPKDNFVSATEKSGSTIPYSTTNIRTNGTVDTRVPGEYPIVYTSYDSNGNPLQTKSATVKVVPAVVQVSHIDRATGKVFDSSTLNGVVGENFRVSADQNENYKFRYAKFNNQEMKEQEITGTYTEAQQTIEFYYDLRGGDITIMYMEEGSNQSLAEPVILSGYIGDSYAIDPNDPPHLIEGYEYSKVSGGLTGEFNANGQLITLYYTREAPQIRSIDFSFGQLSKFTTFSYAEKTPEEMTVSLPKLLENEAEGNWRFSAMLEQPFRSGQHEITTQLTLSELQFLGSEGAELLETTDDWQLNPGIAVPLASLSSSKQEKRQWRLRFGQEVQDKMSGISLRLASTEAKDNTQYSSTVRWTLTNEP